MAEEELDRAKLKVPDPMPWRDESQRDPNNPSYYPGHHHYHHGQPCPVTEMPTDYYHQLKEKPEHYVPKKDPWAKAGEIENLYQMRQFIKRQLGAPLICVELSDEQIDDVIFNCIKYVQRYYLEVGNYRDYLKMELKTGITHYQICQDLASVVDFELTNWLNNGINDLFTVPHCMLYNEMQSMNGWRFGGTCWGNNAGYGNVLGSWNSSLVWLEQLKMDFATQYQVHYNEEAHELTVAPTPKHDEVGLLTVYKRQSTAKIFNSILFRKLVVAECGMLWTAALSKYNLTLAGGGTLNASQMFSNYQTERDKIQDRIDKESPNGYFTVG